MNLKNLDSKRDRMVEELCKDATKAFTQKLTQIRKAGIPTTGMICGMGAIVYQGPEIMMAYQEELRQYPEDDSSWYKADSFDEALRIFVNDAGQFRDYSFSVTLKSHRLAEELIELEYWCINHNIWPYDVVLDPK